MQKTGYFGRLFRLFAAKKISRIAVTFVIFAAVRADSAKPVPTPAMVRHNPAAKTPTVVAYNHSATNILGPSPILILENGNGIPSDQKTNRATNFLPDAHLERQTDPQQRCLIRLAHKKLGASQCSDRWLDIQAGYGRVCYDPADLKKIAPDWEEPGCIYVKASFSF